MGNLGGAHGSRPRFTGGFLLADGGFWGKQSLFCWPCPAAEARPRPSPPGCPGPGPGRAAQWRGGAGRARRGRGRGGGCGAAGRRAAPGGEVRRGAPRTGRTERAGSAGYPAAPGGAPGGGRAGRPESGERPEHAWRWAAASGAGCSRRGTARSPLGSRELRPLREFVFGAAVPARRLLLRAECGRLLPLRAAGSSRFGRFVVMEL